MKKYQAIIITGPTGGGKSNLALQLALKKNGIIINADSMQIYKQIPILSAQPNINGMNTIQHLMYGFIDIMDFSKIYSVGDYLSDLKNALNTVIKQNKTPIIVGGTMLYIQSILNGLNEIDDISLQQKQEIREHYKNKTADEIYNELCKIDPKYSKIVDKYNTHRLLRGIEVKLITGKSITDFWQQKKQNEITDKFLFKKYVIDLPRNILYDRINQRFDKMIEYGATDEAKKIFDNCKQMKIDFNKIPKAIGLHELFDYFENKISFNEAIEKSKQFSRNYAKRQLTWFRNKLNDDFEKITNMNNSNI